MVLFIQMMKWMISLKMFNRLRKLTKDSSNKEKKNSTVLRSEMENLKTEIHQSMGWDAFTKTEKFKTFNALKNQILKQKRS